MRTKKPKFSSCKSPKSYRHLGPGRYTFEVRALNPAGHDPTPAKREFRLEIAREIFSGPRIRVELGQPSAR